MPALRVLLDIQSKTVTQTDQSNSTIAIDSHTLQYSMSANGHHQKTMRAVVWEGKPYEVVVRDVPRPKIEMPEDAIVRITSASICASDIHNYHGIFGSTTPPWTMGHEGVGVVVETGKATEQFKVGDRVIIPCGHDPGSFVVERSTVPNFPFYGAGDDFGGLGGCQGESP